jgi:hypothetical protein
VNLLGFRTFYSSAAVSKNSGKDFLKMHGLGPTNSPRKPTNQLKQSSCKAETPRRARIEEPLGAERLTGIAEGVKEFFGSDMPPGVEK